MSDFFLNIIDEPSSQPSPHREPWKIAIVDDEESVHQATKLAMSRVQVLDRPLVFIHAYSGQEGLQLLKDHPDTAVVLLDVVMETEDAGLALAKKIRTQLNNHLIQIILRTGQPGYAPEESVITDYEVNDYKTKSELTRTKLFSAIYTAIRSYQNLLSMDKSREGLRKIIEASSTLLQEHSLARFSEGALDQINALFNIHSDGIFCVSSLPIDPSSPLSNYLIQHHHLDPDNFSSHHQVVATSERFRSLFGKSLEALPSDEATEVIKQSLIQKKHIIEGSHVALYLDTPSSWEAVIYLHSDHDLIDQIDPEILGIFVHNIALGLENTKFVSQLTDTAYKDDVTALNNRNGLLDNSVPLLLESHNKISIYLIDIDYFHEIIEALGFDYGNQVLIAFAEKLKQIFPEGTEFARLHSDVFAVVVAGEHGLSTHEIVQRCNREPLTLENGNVLRLGVSIGCTLYQAGVGEQESPELMIRHAEVALKKAKEAGRGNAMIYDQTLDQASSERLNLLSELRLALAKSELKIVYQPKVNQLTKQITSTEALLRWPHKALGYISPAIFVPIAEQSGLVYDLDMYVMNRVCQELSQHPDIPRTSINLSAISLDRAELLQDLELITSGFNISKEQIAYEITEGCLIKGQTALNNLNRIAEAGWQLHLDDFGSGYSSLNYLLKLPIHTVKIDQVFMLSLQQTPHAETLLKGIIDLVISIGKELVVEGIETQDHADFTMAAGALIAQGYLYHKPMPLEELLPLLP